MTKAKIKEIFSSIQGEGIYLGVPQIFVRFDGCNTDCIYCDEKKKPAKYELTVGELLKKIKTLDKKSGPHHSISLTGGEPLINMDYLLSFLPALKKERVKVYLETNGTLPEALERLSKHVDIIAMDIKLPSATKSERFWREHKKMLTAARSKVFIKIVVTQDTDKKDFQKAVDMVKNIDARIPFVIQPVSGNGKFKSPQKEKLAGYKKMAQKYLKDVRVIPQVHKILGVA